MLLRDITRTSNALDRKIAKHMRKNYRKAAGVIRLGLSEPEAVLIGVECMVRCLDAEGKEVCISMEEAIGREWLPTLDEIYAAGGLAEEARLLFAKDEPGTRKGARHGWFGKRSDDCVSNIRVIAVSEFSKA